MVGVCGLFGCFQALNSKKEEVENIWTGFTLHQFILLCDAHLQGLIYVVLVYLRRQLSSTPSVLN